ncbi:hypothetical protein J2J97_31875 (plasmid) [Rhizobium bangladeshense]|uniref:hypothetical protein n=1 Tax=Rhizobium bangladeshense TaxID=1138189 RepID=UPI001A98154A|nr:hypothetical protein [Rhizobium bangladeshense]QSY98671.1 hypothetical protein J2J97_31875 [Rhizobium bangladeshense]
MLLQTVIGNENWPSGQTKLHIFVCPTRRFPLRGKEEQLWAVAREGLVRTDANMPSVQQTGSPRIMSAGIGLQAEIVGKWTSSVYELPDDVLLKVSLTRSTVNPQGQRAASILLRTRTGAALRRIEVTTLQNPKSSTDRLTIEGMYDIVDLSHAAEMGYEPPKMYLPTYLQSRWAQMPYLRVIEMAPERISAPRVIRQRVRNSEGQSVEVVTTHRRRALDL